MGPKEDCLQPPSHSLDIGHIDSINRGGRQSKTYDMTVAKLQVGSGGCWHVKILDFHIHDLCFGGFIESV
ncbi:hypothetical protein P8452_28892 [Trifolium repens]|nr:hypothetical protein P8452_28892 [Trifolium repens]